MMGCHHHRVLCKNTVCIKLGRAWSSRKQGDHEPGICYPFGLLLRQYLSRRPHLGCKNVFLGLAGVREQSIFFFGRRSKEECFCFVSHARTHARTHTRARAYTHTHKERERERETDRQTQLPDPGGLNIPCGLV